MKNFRFDKKEHLYFLDDKPLTGVTTVLQVIAKPALIQWAANEAIKSVEEQMECDLSKEFEDLTIPQYTRKVFKEILNNARTAHRKKKQDAGTKGTDIHAEIETIINGAIKNFAGYIQGYLTIEDNEQIKKFCDWAVENKVKFLSCEQQVYSEKHWLAGTYDFIAEIKGKKFIGDIKTSSKIYGREYFAQTAAYRLMLEEMGQNGINGSVIIRLGKNGDFEEKYSYDYQNDKKLFLSCLDVYRTMGTFEDYVEKGKK